MEVQELEKIYELSYKYGWLTSVEREEGWLPDKAYMEKSKLEQELRPLIIEGLNTFVEVFNEYDLDEIYGTWDKLLSKFRNAKSINQIDRSIDNIYYFVMRTYGDVPATYEFDNYTIKAIDSFCTYIDTEYQYRDELLYNLYTKQKFSNVLYDNFANDFMFYVINETTDKESLYEELDNLKHSVNLRNVPEEQEESYAYISSHFEDFLWWCISTPEITLRRVSDLIDVDFSDLAYLVDLDPSLLDIIIELFIDNCIFPAFDYFVKYIDRLKNANNLLNTTIMNIDTTDFSDLIVVFQELLTTAHATGYMGAYLLGFSDTESDNRKARKILDKLSNTIKQEWNKDLEQILGYDPTQRSNETQTWYQFSNLKKAIKMLEQTASILDYPREELDEKIWNIENEQVTLQPQVEAQIEDIVYSALDDLDLPEEALKDLFIYGSILSNQYNSNTDIDARIVLDPEITYEHFNKDITGDDLFDLIVEQIHDIAITGTNHPFNATIIIEGEDTKLAKSPLGKTDKDPVYDVLNHKIINEPTYTDFYDPDTKYKEERTEADNIMDDLDDMLRELRTDTIDYTWIEDAVKQVKDKDMLKKKLDNKLEEIKQDVKELVNEYSKIKEERTKSYTEGEGHEGTGNIIAKLLEKYGYLDAIKQLKLIMKDSIQEDEVDDVAEAVEIEQEEL